MHTILGAGGAIANELAKVLLANNQALRLVSRNPETNYPALLRWLQILPTAHKLPPQ